MDFDIICTSFERWFHGYYLNNYDIAIIICGIIVGYNAHHHCRPIGVYQHSYLFGAPRRQDFQKNLALLYAYHHGRHL